MVSVEHLALCPVQFAINPPKLPRVEGLFISSPFEGGGGGELIEMWGQLTNSLNFGWFDCIFNYLYYTFLLNNTPSLLV